MHRLIIVEEFEVLKVINDWLFDGHEQFLVFGLVVRHLYWAQTEKHWPEAQLCVDGLDIYTTLC